MSTYTNNYRPQGGNFPNRGGGSRRNDNRPYRSHGPTAQHSQLGTPPIMQHIPRAPTVSMPGRVLIPGVPPTAGQPLLMGPTLTGPNARAPTVFPQNIGVVPQAVPQQILTQNPAAGLPGQPFFLPQQPQFVATQQPINLGMANAAQIGAASAPQQISGGMHTLPHMIASVNTGVGTMSQVPPTNTTSYRGVSMPMSRPSVQPATKRQSKAIKIIDPNTKKEVNMGGSKPETSQPAPLETSTVSTDPVPSGVVTFSTPPTGHVTGSVAQDFKRMVHERNVTSGTSVQSPAVTSAYKPPPPNAIITDPNKAGGVLTKIGASEVSSSKPILEEDLSAQQQQRQPLVNQPPTSAIPPTVSESAQKCRDEFRQKVLQSVNTTSVADEGKAVTQEVKNGSQESISSQNVGENLKEASVPPAASAPVDVSPDGSATQLGESENIAPSEDKTVPPPPASFPAAQTTSNDSEQTAVTSETQTDVQPVEPAQPVKPESDEVAEDVTPPAPVPSTVEPVSEKIEDDVPEKVKEDSAQSIQTEDTGSQPIDSETPAGTQQQLEEKAVEEVEEDSERKEEPAAVETSQLPQVTPKVEEAPKQEEEKPPKSEPEPKESVKKADAVPSSAVLVPESAPVTVKEAPPPPPPAVEELPDVDSEAKRTEKPENVESEKESKPAVLDQQEPLISSEIATKEKVNGEPKEELLPPKQVQQDQQADAVPATKPIKEDKPVVDEGKRSPPTKPKEVVKPAEQGVVKPEKQDKPASAKPAAAVPASAQLAPASEPPPSAPQPSQNALGRTMYQRDFLLRFKDFCKEVPPELEQTDVFKLNAHRDHHILPPMSMRGEYPREYSRDRDYPRKGGRSRPDNRRGNYQPVSKEPVDLHKAENRWIRPAKEDVGETEELFRKFQGILNKLTPQKFQNLAEQALKLQINSEERLKGCIDKIFTKALEEPKFSIAYANLCKVMSTIKVEVPTEEGKPKVITFRRVLLTKCQQEFEKDKKDDEDREKMLSAIKETEDAEKKKQLQNELDVNEVKNRKRSLGNIRFIGELFKLKMLSETIMHECVVRLLRSSSDEESLECFAGLITTTGKDLDHPDAKTRINQYFTRIAEIIKKGKIPARIKFMLQDVQELRGNNWVPRQRQEQSLKTIDQIHHEAKVEEEKEKQFVAAVMAGSMKHGGGSRRGSSKPDDWQGGKGDRDRRDKDRDRDRDRDKPKEKLDARRLQVLLKHREKSKDSGPPTLGPSNLRPQGWGRGGSGASNAVPDSAKSDKDKRPSRASSSGTKRSDKDKLPLGRGSGSGPKRGHSTPTPDSQSEKALAIQAVQQVTTRQQPSQKQEQLQSKGQPSSRAEHKASQPVPDKMDEATVRRKTTTIVDELVQNKDFKEALECVREMKSPGKMNFLVSEAINHSFEKSSQHRQFSGRLFSKLVQGRHISEEKFMEGLNEVLEFAEDIAIDIPKIWDYLGEILSPVVSQSALPLSILASIYPSLLSSGKAGLLAAKVLVQCRSQLSSDEEVASIWSSSSLEWSALGVPSEDLGEFLSSHNLTYLQGSSQPSTDSRPLKYVTELTHQFSAPDTTNEDIVNWIEKNCPPPVLRTPEFVTTVTTAIVNATVSGSGSSAQFEGENFSKRALLIKKYVENDRGLQLRVLYALQIAVAHLQHPPGMLDIIFNQIYDLEIVGEEEFRRWKDKGTEGFGKGAAVATVKNFFDWLDSGETESDDAAT